MVDWDDFWSNADASGGPDACWPWTGKKTGSGYGMYDGITATRLILASEGVDMPGMFACHRCDNRVCVNPRHLFAGTPADNSADMVAKGRQCRGERCHTARLSESDVVTIRNAYARGGITQAEIAARYGIAQVNVSRMLRGDTWKHVGGPTKRRERRDALGRGGGQKLSDRDVSAVRAAIACGERVADLAAQYGVSTSLIYLVKRGYRD